VGRSSGGVNLAGGADGGLVRVALHHVRESFGGLGFETVLFSFKTLRTGSPRGSETLSRGWTALLRGT